MKKNCSKCGQLFMPAYSKSYCPDCAEPIAEAREMSSFGREDMVKHFDQDIGLRLQRLGWGHFDGLDEHER